MNKCCIHCEQRMVTRPRGLCWSCYYTPGVKDMYPVSSSKHARRGVGNLTGVRPLPATPTKTAVGTDDRVAVYAERAERGEQLWHPEDSLKIGADVRPCYVGRPIQIQTAATIEEEE